MNRTPPELRLAHRTLQALALGAATTALASAGYRRYADARDRRRFPPPGELIDVGGRRLHIVRAGTGTPVVIIDACLGGSVLEWAAVQRQLAAHTTVITYDRAGLGWSDPPPWPHTASRAATDLHRLLDAATIPTPVILVGHSYGGSIARLFAARHPELLAGLVLVDSTHHDQLRRMGAIDPRYRPLARGRRLARAALAHSGLARLVEDRGWRRQATQQRHARYERIYPDRPVEAAAMNRWTGRADWWEMALMGPGAAEVRAEASHIGELPLTVITAGQRGPGLTRDALHREWMALQADLAALSERSTRVIADRAGHHVHRDDPELVTRVLHDIVEQIRAGRSARSKPSGRST